MKTNNFLSDLPKEKILFAYKNFLEVSKFQIGVWIETKKQMGSKKQKRFI